MLKSCLCFAVLFWSVVAAQAAPKAEIFGGYQFTHLDGGANMNGWNAALTGNLNSWFGITADFSGAYKSGVKFSTYTFGPEISARLPIVKPFVHALFGGARLSGGGAAFNGFDMYLGGGVDAGHGPFAWRVAQFDWMTTRFSGVTDHNNVRFSTGIVVRF
ncbi:MAG TPA: hypothetical protein VFB00_09615 [Terriglobales bacterium]|nr:hypothetical protein [Terriglobales bacterium]